MRKSGEGTSGEVTRGEGTRGEGIRGEVQRKKRRLANERGHERNKFLDIFYYVRKRGDHIGERDRLHIPLWC